MTTYRELSDLTDEQWETFKDTARNMGGHRMEIAMKTSAGGEPRPYLHIYDREGDCVWHSRVDDNGKYS